jgi:hypothetical protein
MFSTYLEQYLQSAEMWKTVFTGLPGIFRQNDQIPVIATGIGTLLLAYSKLLSKLLPLHKITDHDTYTSFCNITY